MYVYFFVGGYSRDRLETTQTRSALYHIYRDDYDNQLGYGVFLRVYRDLHVLKAKHSLFDLFGCELCHTGIPGYQDLISMVSDPVLKATYELNIQKISLHQFLASKQRTAYQKMINNLSLNECVIIQDFGKKFTQDGKAVILVLVMFFKVESHIQWRYFDFFGKKGKSGFAFVEKAWLCLLKSSAFHSFSHIHVWSDGCTSEFYNSSALYFFSTFKDTFHITVDVSFFEAYHGHSICDSHLGTGKRKVKKLEQYLVSTYSETFVYEVFSSLKNTSGQTLGPVDKATIVAKTLHGIHEFKHFTFEETGKVHCFHFTGSSEFETHIITLVTPNDSSGSSKVKCSRKRKRDEDILYPVGTKVDVNCSNELFYCGIVEKVCNKTRYIKFLDPNDPFGYVKLKDLRLCTCKEQISEGHQ